MKKLNSSKLLNVIYKPPRLFIRHLRFYLLYSKIMNQNPIDKRLNVLTKYHYYVFFLLFSSKIPMFWHILNLIFLSPPMKYSCKGAKQNVTGHCPCDSPEWDRSVFTETMQTKFGVYCDNSWMISFSQSMAYAGTLVGAFLYGFLSDK